MPHNTKLTKENVDKLLGFIMEGFSISESAIKCGLNPKTVYTWRYENSEFAQELKHARAIGTQVHLVPIARNRARDGWQEPVFYEGQQVGEVTKYDNNLLWKLIQAGDDDYKTQDKTEVNVTVNLGESMSKAEQRVKGK